MPSYSFDGHTWQVYPPGLLEKLACDYPGKDLFDTPPPPVVTRQERHKAYRKWMHREAAQLLAAGASIDYRRLLKRPWSGNC